LVEKETLKLYIEKQQRARNLSLSINLFLLLHSLIYYIYCIHLSVTTKESQELASYRNRGLLNIQLQESSEAILRKAFSWADEMAFALVLVVMYPWQMLMDNALKCNGHEVIFISLPDMNMARARSERVLNFAGVEVPLPEHCCYVPAQ
jgi:hypothetical protein